MMSRNEERIEKIMELLKDAGERELDLIYAFILSLTKK